MSSTSGVVTGVQQSERNQEATIWIGGIEPQVTEELLYELFINVGPVGNDNNTTHPRSLPLHLSLPLSPTSSALPLTAPLLSLLSVPISLSVGPHS
jgi:hypothetical protein